MVAAFAVLLGAMSSGMMLQAMHNGDVSEDIGHKDKQKKEALLQLWKGWLERDDKSFRLDEVRETVSFCKSLNYLSDDELICALYAFLYQANKHHPDVVKMLFR